MKSFLPNLLLALAIALCALCAVQWTREARLRRELVALQQIVRDKTQSEQTLQASLKRADAELARMDARNLDLKQTGQTNSQDIAALRQQLKQSASDAATLRAKLAEYTTAVERQNESIRRQNESLAKQNKDIGESNAALKRLADERNAWVKKHDESVLKFNDLVRQYNALVKQLEAAQAKPKPPEGK